MIARASIDRTAQLPAAPSASSPRVATARGTRVRLVLWIGTTALLLAGLWWVAAPPQLGGRTSFVEVDGTSMLPRLRYGDLVLLRSAKSYRVGEVVGYRSPLLDRVVLHRIVADDHGRYTFKGDNNGFLDPEHPTRASIVGREWLVVPSVGKLVAALHVPWVVGALAGLLVLILGLGGGATGSGDERSTRRAR